MQMNHSAPTGKTAMSTRRLVECAFFVALSIVLTHVLTISTGFVRFNLGGLPILLSGILFGPLAGFTVGAVSDLIGGTLMGYSINPFITLGTASIGGIMGLCYRHFPAKKRTLRVLSGVVLANLIGSVIINSLALRIYYGYAWSVLALRIPNNLIIGTAEFFILCHLLSHKGFLKAFPLPSEGASLE